jgi:hypothetical protein
MWQFFFFFWWKFGGFSQKKKEYTTRVSLPLHIFIFRICAELRTAKPPPNMYLSFWVGFKNGFIEFWPPRNRGSPPPVPTLVAAPSGRHDTGSPDNTRDQPLRRSQETTNAHTPPVIIASSCANSAFFHSFLEKRERQRQRKRSWSKERAPASGDRARSAEETWSWEQNDDGVNRISIKYGERHWQWERNCRDREKGAGGGFGVSRARD